MTEPTQTLTEWLDEIEAEAAQATPGPWVVDYGGSLGHIKSLANEDGRSTPTVAKYDVWHYRNMLNEVVENFGRTFEQQVSDGAFIAASRQNVPALVAKCRELAGLVRECIAHRESVMDFGEQYAECREIEERMRAAVGMPPAE